MHVLLIERDDRRAAELRTALMRYGITSTRLDREGRAVLDHLIDVDVVLLSLGHRRVGSTDACQAIRGASDVPIIVLSGLVDVSERVLGLYLGADDWLVEPYELRELVARLEAVGRRGRRWAPAPGPERRVLDVEDLTLDLTHRTVRVDGASIRLTPQETRLLEVLVAADGAVCSRHQLMLAIWGRRLPHASRSLNVLVANLRTKLRRPELVRTVRGLGYRLSRQTSAAQQFEPAAL